MFRRSAGLYLAASVVVLALAAGQVDAFPGVAIPRPGVGGKRGNHRANHKTKKTGGPLDTAIKDLKSADSVLESKKLTNADKLTHAAEQIVSQLAKQANGKDGDKDRGNALESALKDIREAERQISARKPDDASTAVKSAISGLEALTDAGKKAKAAAGKKKKKN